ncbi:MAG: MBL fold metallo-hydrolase [Sphingomonadales bacterium]|nr:MBL fold metallo-hydrolase [Sphingomonadales bacterium]MDE2172162.1 MBL fold metallo-hydrolase [Sphingomonadales bacterium]
MLMSLASANQSAAQAPTPAPALAKAGQAGSPEMIVTLLGTGTPTLSPVRFGYSTLVQAGGLNLVFDAGRGNAIRLAQLGVPLGKVTATFITHYHSDHLIGLPDLWTTSILQSPQNRRDTPFELYGPVGIKGVAAGMEAMFSSDLKIRKDDGEVRGQGEMLDVHEFTHDGVVFERNGVRVTAFTVDHGAVIKPAVGYKIEYHGHSVVLSGDTRFNQNVIDEAKGSDLLVHEVSIISTHHNKEAWAQSSINHHTSPEEAGTVFARSKPKLAVFSHISRPGPQDETNTDEALESRAQAQWPNGRITVGTDLMQITIGDAITTTRWPDPLSGK